MSSNSLTPELAAKLRKLRLLVLDVDGTLTDGGIYIGNNGEEFKRFDAHDGAGIKTLQQDFGLEVMFLSGRNCKPVELRAKELGVKTCLQGHFKKTHVLLDYLASNGYTPGETAMMGDDLGDLEVMKLVSIGFAPANAVWEVREHASFVTKNKGGEGAVREVCEIIIRGRVR